MFLENWFDPQGQAQYFNAVQAQLDRDFQSNEAKIARDFSALEAQKNRDFQADMSNTAYQRAVADLKASGLNPYLAYSQGGASTPVGSSPQVSSAQGSKASVSPGKNMLGEVLKFVGSALSVASSFAGSKALT